MIIGIDLGTTNSLASVWCDGVATLIPNALGRLLTPSSVSLDDRTGEILVGEAARERLGSHPEHSAAAFKRMMGTSRTVALGARRFRPEELSSFVLRALKADAEVFLGSPVHEAIITVPAYFNDAQRKATKIAGELVGLRIERVLNEPTAAALTYGLHERRSGRDGKILVFDLGADHIRQGWIPGRPDQHPRQLPPLRSIPITKPSFRLTRFTWLATRPAPQETSSIHHHRANDLQG